MEKLKNKIQKAADLYRSNKLNKAEAFCKKIIEEYPRTVYVYNLLGLILTEQKKITEAIKFYELGIKIDPEFAIIYSNLGNIYKYKKNYTEAENYFRKSIEKDRKIPEPYNNLGNLYFFLNEYEKSIFYFNEALNVSPNFFISHYNLGVVHKTLGNIEKSSKYFKKCIDINLHFFPAHRNLSLITKYKKEDSHFKILNKIYDDFKNKNIENAELSFSLGKAYEDMKNFEKSFYHYNKGNNIRRKKVNFSMDKTKEEFFNLKQTFNKNNIRENIKLFNKSEKAIFIVGMPRSGTTLVEQILSSHPKISAGDELNYFPEITQKYFYEKDSLFFKDLNAIKEEDFKKAGNEYIQKLEKLSKKSKYVTDKLPINFKLIGLIKLILPNSKIIHCKRNPRDVCLSIFKNYFTNNNLNFAYNIEEITEYYILYNDLMKHWSNIFPNFFYDVEYENIISNPEKSIKNLLKACDLKWNDKCLKFYKNKRPIKTASDVQVRRKIYKTSLNSWKNFENSLLKSIQKLPN